MKEAYVSFGTAKLLKEKGFDWECYGTYNIIEEVLMNEHSVTVVSHTNKNSTLGNAWISAPTQQMACRWLREEHKIDISVTPDDGSWWIKVTELESWSSVFNGKVLNSDDIKFAYEGDTNTKEDCYEAGLWYVLKNLI